MTYDEYYKAAKALKPPANFSLVAKIDWLRIETDKLKKQLSKETLLLVLKDEAAWQAKVDSSLDESAFED